MHRSAARGIRAACALVVALTVPACHGSHDTMDDASVPADALTSWPSDGSMPGPSDASAGRDATTLGDGGEPLPPLPDDEPAVPPDTRPSDAPGRPSWGEPPAIGATDDCCTVEEVVPADAMDEDGDWSSLAWTSPGWAAAGRLVRSSPRPVGIRRFDVLGSPTLAPREVAELGELVGPLAWGNGRLAVGSATYGEGTSGSYRALLSILDGEGRVRASTTMRRGLSLQALIRHPTIGGFAAVARVRIGDEPPTHSVVTWRDGAPEPEERSIGRAGEHSYPAGLAFVGSRLVTVQGNRELVVLRALANAELLETDRTVLDYGGSASVVPFRDLAAVLVRRWTGPATLQSILYDPFEGRVVAGPTSVLDIGIHTPRAHAADDVGGTIGVCYDASGADGPEVRFALLGDDGARLGRTVRVARGSGCAIAVSAPDEYAVACTGCVRHPGHRLHVTRVRVQRPAAD